MVSFGGYKLRKGVIDMSYLVDTNGMIIRMSDGSAYNLNGKPIGMDIADQYPLTNIGVNKEKKEKKMGKFKVGDIVRLKSVDGMDSVISDDIKKLASTNGVIANTFNYNDDVEPTYFLRGYEGYYIKESMFENRTYSKDDIFNINVIVSDKVVETEFCDGKEKMVCHEEDTFDLRKCCFIAIAKHLYKKEYTYEGIEYMAEQLMYQKKYVKIVDKAMKEYQRKEDEKAKKARMEEEERIIRARQKVKRWKKKQARIERQETERNEALKAEREEMVSMMAEAINRAKDQRKKSKE